MGRLTRGTFTWEGASARFDRLAEANRRAEETWLRALSMEESARIFEDLCRGIPELHVRSDLDPPPIVLWPLWRY